MNSVPVTVPVQSLGEINGYLAGLERQLAQLREENRSLQEQIDGLGRLSVSEQVTEDWLQIPYRFVGFASGAAGVVTRTVGGDGPFDLIEITATSVSSSGVPNDNWRILIKEGESVGRALTQDSVPIDLSNTAGTAQRPYIIKGRRRYRANIAIQVEVTNTFPGPDTNTLELVLHGVKVFVR